MDWKIKELITLAKARPGQLNYGGTHASPNHLAMELLNSQAGVKIVLISYKGTGQIVSDLVAGQLKRGLSDSDLFLPLLGLPGNDDEAKNCHREQRRLSPALYCFEGASAQDLIQ